MRELLRNSRHRHRHARNAAEEFASNANHNVTLQRIETSIGYLEACAAKIPNKDTLLPFLFCALWSRTVIVISQRHPPAPQQAQSPHEMPHHSMEAAQEATPDTTQAAAYYQAESTRRMAERLRKLSEEANPETNIYANDKRVLYFKSKTRPLELWGQLQLEALLATELLYAGQSEEAIQLFNRILETLSANRQGFAPHLIATTEEYLALSYLRLGEQYNTHLC